MMNASNEGKGVIYKCISVERVGFLGSTSPTFKIIELFTSFASVVLQVLTLKLF